MNTDILAIEHGPAEEVETPRARHSVDAVGSPAYVRRLSDQVAASVFAVHSTGANSAVGVANAFVSALGYDVPGEATPGTETR